MFHIEHHLDWMVKGNAHHRARGNDFRVHVIHGKLGSILQSTH